MLKTAPPAGAETSQQQFESLLARPAFQGLKAILDRVSVDPAKLYAEIKNAPSYEDLLAKLGYKLTLIKQIHVQDCYSKLSPAGGIKAVLPYYHIPNQSSLPTLVNYDGTVTTTLQAAMFFNAMLGDLKKQLGPA